MLSMSMINYERKYCTHQCHHVCLYEKPHNLFCLKSDLWRDMLLIYPMAKTLFENDITGAQISQTYDLSALGSILKEYTIGLIISSSRHSSLAISYKSTILLSCHHKIAVHISGTYFHLPCPFEFFSFWKLTLATFFHIELIH